MSLIKTLLFKVCRIFLIYIGSFSFLFAHPLSAAVPGLNFPNLPTATISVYCTTLLAGNNATLTANATAGSGTIVSFEWVLNGSTVVGTNSPNCTTSIPGSYTVKVTNSDGDFVISNAVVIENESPLSGTYTIGGVQDCATNYSSMAYAAIDLNNRGLNGNVIFTFIGNPIEMAPPGGIVFSYCGLAASLKPNANQQVSFIGPVTIQAPVGVSSTLTSGDGVIKLEGADWFTFDQVNIADNNINNLTQMEWGYALLKCDGNNGSNFNTIKHCTIALKKTNFVSCGIYSGNHNASGVLTPAYNGGAFSSAVDSSRNGHNIFIGNNISNVNNGIYINGNPLTSGGNSPLSLNDTLNEVGQTGAGLGNSITNFGGNGTVASGVIGANQRGIKVENNLISGGTGSTGVVSGINITSGVWGEIGNNSIALTSSATAAGITGILCSLSGGDAVNPNIATITGNIIQASAAWTSPTTSLSASFFGINSQSGGNASIVTISNNTVQNISFSGSGTFIGISCGSPSNLIATSNTITGISKTGMNASGTMTCFTSGSIQTSSSITNNTINNNSITLSADLIGSINGITGSSPVVGNWMGNTISNLSILGSTTATTSSIVGLQCSPASVSSTLSITGNSISSLSSVSGLAASISGMHIITGINMTVNSNLIFNLSAGGTNGIARGLLFSGGNIGSVYHIFNNRIGDLKAPFANPSVLNGNAVIGIDIAAISTSPTFNICNNSIVLAGTGGGAFFGSSGIYANTGPTVSLRNNIIINTITSGASSHTVAYRRSSSSLTSYANNSNNNIFFTGIPSSLQAIFFDGTQTDVTLTAFQTRFANRDNNSKTENVPFLSTTGGNINYLKINPSIPTFVEGAGIPDAGITTDFEGDIRNQISPDIGADEGSFINLSMALTSVSKTPSINQCTSVNHLVTATVVPGNTYAVTNVSLSYYFDGLPGIGSPLVMTNTGGNTWTGTIPAATPSNALVTWSVTATDAGSYTSSSSLSSYQDDYLQGTPFTATLSNTTICKGSTVTLSSIFAGPQIVPTGYCVSTGVNFTDEQIFGVTFGSMNNSQQAEFCNSNYSDYTGTILPPTVILGNNVAWSVFQSECDGATYFANGISIFIDYNRDGDFLDAGEQAFTTNSLVVGPRTLSGIITIPNSASLGLTRMRVVCAEGFPAPSSCLQYNYGETEDYLVNIVGGLGFTYSWSDGNTTIATTQNAIYTPTVAGSYNYTVTASDQNGCTLTSSIPLMVLELPVTPNSTNSIQCGLAIPDCYVTGSGGAFRWYLTASGGAALAGENGNALSFFAINTTTTFYVSEFDGICESQRAMSIQEVTSTPPIVVSNTATIPICPFVDFDLIATGGGYTSFSWTASPSSGSGITVPLPGNSETIHATQGGTFIYTVIATDGICSASGTTSVTVIAPPSIVVTGVSPDTVCSGESITLKSMTNQLGAGDVVIGNDTLTNLSTTYPTPYGAFYTGGRLQMLVRASELSAAGLYAGNITSLSFNIAALNSLITYRNFTIRIAPTSLTALTNSFISNGFSTVYSNALYTPNSGINSHIFNNGIFNWDGISNIVVEVTFLNCTTCPGTPCINYTFNASTFYTQTTFASSINAFSDFDCGIASRSTGTVYLKRPNMIFSGQTLLTGPGTLVWQWSPGAIPSGNIANVNPVNATTNPVVNNYLIQATDVASGCSNYKNVSVTVNPLPLTPSNIDGAHCGMGVPTCSVSASSGSFRWYLTATGGTPLAGETLDHLVSYRISSTRYFYVSNWNGICESDRVAVYEEVYPSDSITAFASIPTCPNPTINLSVTKATGTNSFVYTWTASPATGSGIPVSVVGDNINVFPTAAGTYVYSVLGHDSNFNCSSFSSVTVQVISCNTEVTLNTKMFIEGYYAAGNSGLMDNSGLGGCLFLNGISPDPNDVDSVEISMMDASTYSLIDAQLGELKIDGTVSVTFGTSVVRGTPYYIRVKHRNALQTWSANPVITNAITSYDFTSAQTNAYGNNTVLTGDGLNWAFYSGDISDAGTGAIGIQDEVIESQDYSDMENAVVVTLLGYVAQDITGDVIVESLDYSIMENNVYFVIQSMHP